MNGNDIGITVYWNIVFDLIFNDFDSKNIYKLILIVGTA
jgi:hypothetical protein